MTPEYHQFVRKLFKDGALIHADLHHIPDAALSRLHATIGICGEIQELYEAIQSGDEENIMEELGDYFFYVTALQQHTTAAKLIVDPSEITGDQVTSAAHRMLDLCKKECIYAKQLSKEQIAQFESDFGVVIHGIQITAELMGWTPADVINANVAKLQKRYPGAIYSNEAAQARVDKIGEEAASDFNKGLEK